MATNIITAPLGVDISVNDGTTQKHALGKVVWDDVGNSYRYVKAGGSIAVEDVVVPVNSTTPYTGAVASSAATQTPIGVGIVAMSSGDYGWIQRSGKCRAKLVSASLADGDALTTSGTAGTFTKSAAADLGNSFALCLVDDTTNTGTVLLYCP